MNNMPIIEMYEFGSLKNETGSTAKYNIEIVLSDNTKKIFTGEDVASVKLESFDYILDMYKVDLRLRLLK